MLFIGAQKLQLQPWRGLPREESYTLCILVDGKVSFRFRRFLMYVGNVMSDQR